MDLEELVTESNKLLGEFERNWGPVSLFMLLANDLPAWNGWKLIASAKGLDESPEQERRAFHLYWKFHGALRPELQKLLTSFRVHRTDERLVQELVFAFGGQKPVVHIQSWYVAGQQLPHAMILEAKKVAA